MPRLFCSCVSQLLAKWFLLMSRFRLDVKFQPCSIFVNNNPRLRCRPKSLSDQTFQTEIISDQTFQTEINPDQTFQTQDTSDQTFQTQRVSDQTF